MKAEKLHGALIANMVMTRSLLTVLPTPALEKLQAELALTLEEGHAHVLGERLSDPAVEAYGHQADLYLGMVELEIQQRREPDPSASA